jgi:hypothetical protein
LDSHAEQVPHRQRRHHHRGLGEPRTARRGDCRNVAAQVSNCGEVSAKPTGLVLSCADANTALEMLKWSSWGTSTARATGTFSENDCSPTCVEGMFHRYKAVVTLSAPKMVKGAKVFTKVRVVFPGITDQSNRTFNLG